MQNSSLLQIVENELYISHSQINTYLNCSLRYELQYIRKLPPERVSIALPFGSAIHAAVELYFRSLKNQGRIEPLKALWQRFEDCLSLDLDNTDVPVIYKRDMKEEKNQLKERAYMMNMFSRLFEFGYIDKQVRKSDGAVRAREYFVIFNTILGELFVHNLKMGNFDWVREDLYSLPPSAQIFFRKFILNNNFPSIPLNLQTIAQKLNLNDKIHANLERTVVTNVLEPLKRQGFIETYDKELGLHDVKFIIKRNFTKTD